ncbi:MAG: nickel-dependent hydrogenase large subunit, partial [Chitinispirillia bacterium]
MIFDMNIDIDHVARIEGHGNIHITVKKGKLENAQWAVVETPRFFEAILRGKSFDLAPTLTSRICGICSISHTLVSIRAVERAMQVTVPKPAKLLRLLAKHGETMQSHILHLFFLVAPDFFNAGSILPIVTSHPDLAQIAIRLKGMANDMCDIVTGRTTHPISLVIGGLSMAPDKSNLAKLKQMILDRRNDVFETIGLFKTLSIPDFSRETEFVSLKGESDYAWIGGNLISTDGIEKKEDDYLDM